MTRFGAWLLLVSFSLLFTQYPATVGAEESLDAAYFDQISASDSYYTLNVEEGSMSVRVEMTIQSAGGELSAVFFWGMPTAHNVVVTLDGLPLEAEVTPGIVELDTLSKIIAPLPAPIVGAQRLDVVMEYDVSPHWGSAVRMEPGLMELAFTGQGVGSFVFLDLPVTAENYVDPGCVMVASQPVAITAAGFERYVCGEATMVALSLDDPEVIRDCARLDDRCRQRVSVEPYSAYLQSISDPSKQGALQADVVLGDRTISLEFLYFIADRDWAERQFDVAVRALPLLEEAFGFEYPLDTLVMRESHKLLELGYAGLAFPTGGELLIIVGTGFDDEVTVHELAHQWAGFNLNHPWLWEGQAEWATAVVAPQLGIELIDRTWDSLPYDDPLVTWFGTSQVGDPDYWYGKAGAFWEAYEEAIGAEEMHAVLAATDDDPSLYPLDGRWFIDRGELESGVNLDALFLEWVWVELSATPLLEDRRVAWDSVEPLRDRVKELGLAGLPKDIQTLLDAWTFVGVGSRTDEALVVFDELEAVAALGDQHGLGTVNPIGDAWTTLTVDELSGRVESQRQTILTIVDSEQKLEGVAPDAAAWDTLEEAKTAYGEGDFSEASSLAAGAVAFAANVNAAADMVAVAKKRQEEFSAGFFARVGLMFADPDADLAAAEQALAEGDTATALLMAQRAYKGWESVSANGIKLLAILAAVLGAFCVGGWWGLFMLKQKADRKKSMSQTGGHFLEENSNGMDWRNWESQAKSGDD